MTESNEMRHILNLYEESNNNGAVFILINNGPIELKFNVGASGVSSKDFPGASGDEFIKGIIALLVDETESGRLNDAGKVAGLLADYYNKDVLVLDARMNQDDMLVGELHFVDGNTFGDRCNKAKSILSNITTPSTSSTTLH